MARSLASKPTMPELLNFTTASGEEYKLLEEIGTHYNDFGIMILNDKTGGITAYIAQENQNRVVATNRDILTRWLAGEGKEPVSWSTLIDVLKNVGLKVLAQTIKKDLTTSGEMWDPHTDDNDVY